MGRADDPWAPPGHGAEVAEELAVGRRAQVRVEHDGPREAVARGRGECGEVARFVHRVRDGDNDAEEDEDGLGEARRDGVGTGTHCSAGGRR